MKPALLAFGFRDKIDNGGAETLRKSVKEESIGEMTTFQTSEAL